MTTKLFGEPVRRREDARLIVGKGRYLDDIGAHALAAAFVRSPHAHARITDVDVEGALDVEGLVAIYTYEDLTGPMAEPLPVLIPHPQLHAPRTGYPLANGEVNHVGEPVVMVVATDRYLAEDAAERIVVSYEELPVVVGVDAAREAAVTPSTRRSRTTSPRGTTRRPGTSRRRWPPRRARSPSRSTSSAAPACRWRARACTRGGTTPMPACASTRARRRRRPCGRRSRRSWSCRWTPSR